MLSDQQPSPLNQDINSSEQQRLELNEKKDTPLELWGPYLSERQWGTVREDYSPNGTAWEYFPHDHARSRVYRWGEDGIAGICDFNQHLCFALALWNGQDPILKERLFGLTGNEGNHGEDVKELYYYLDNTPTHGYMRYLYKYPQQAYPYNDLVETNRKRGKLDPEYEILDTGVFDNSRYFDVFVTYAKKTSTDILVRIDITNHYHDKASLTVLPTIWFRNKWNFNPYAQYPDIKLVKQGGPSESVQCSHHALGDYMLYFQQADKILFTENETNTQRLYNYPNKTPFVKDAFHEVIINEQDELLKDKTNGTKCSPVYYLTVEGQSTQSIFLRLSNTTPVMNEPFGEDFIATFNTCKKQADEFYQRLLPENADKDLINIQRQAFAGLLWSKQFYNYNIPAWLAGDPGQPVPPESRKYGRNHSWVHLNNHDVMSMPDKWEYPWYAAWDLAFHCVALSIVDPVFAKGQLILIMREWYMHPNGQIPAYEWSFSDVNPPVHAWAALEIYRLERSVNGAGDVNFLKRVFQKLMINFTWWVNQKDANGNNIFEGGFLGLDNISLFNRSAMLPDGGTLEQADGTSWMGMYALNMMEMALEIAIYDPAFEDVATKFYEHFVYIAASLNNMGIWDEEDGFYYDILSLPDGRQIPLKVRSIVGLTSLFAVSIMDLNELNELKDFQRRINWFHNYRAARNLYLPDEQTQDKGKMLLSLVHKDKLVRLLERVLNENEFLSVGGIRSVSKYYKDNPFSLQIDGHTYSIDYEPGESTSGLFGGNSNWRGPVWMPINYLLIQSIRNYYFFYGDSLKVECPKGSGNWLNLLEVADELANRLINIFRKDNNNQRRVFGDYTSFYQQQENKELVQFFEYFHGDTGRGVGASHQTGWTALIVMLIQNYGWK
jgi:Mannosylglycerate hydrolase MGH1-like glycoside hydrolase domain